MFDLVLLVMALVCSEVSVGVKGDDECILCCYPNASTCESNCNTE